MASQAEGQTVINDFHARGYGFLSNFYTSPVLYEGVMYPTVEHAFQAAKTTSVVEREEIRRCVSPASAKKQGRSVVLRPDWEKIKLQVMLDLLRQKFAYPDLRKSLLATGDEELVEGNWWGDTYWGVCKGVGTNHLGKLLMQVRREIRASTSPNKADKQRVGV